MADPLAMSNPEAYRLLIAFELFKQTYGAPSSELETQAFLAALATAMGIRGPKVHALIQQVEQYHRQGYGLQELSVEATGQVVPTIIIQQAKTRLASLEAMLILRIRTYLQRVSSKLAAAEFVMLTKAAVALLADEHPELNVSLVERKHLLFAALRTFGTQLSQPIPGLGEQIPRGVARFVTRLVRYQKIMGMDGVSAVCAQLVSPTSRSQHLSPGLIRHLFKGHNIIVEPDLETQDGLEDLTKVLLFERQLQTPSVAKLELVIAQQIEQAIAEFKAKSTIAEITHPLWDQELSVSSVLFNPDTFATANNKGRRLSDDPPKETSRDETNP